MAGVTPLLPTPSVSDSQRFGATDAARLRANPKHMTVHLSDEVAGLGVSVPVAGCHPGRIPSGMTTFPVDGSLLPTPASARWALCDGRNPAMLEAGGHTPQLNDRVEYEMRVTSLMPTPTARDVNGENQRRDETCVPGAVAHAIHTNRTGTDATDVAWGLDDGRGVDFGRFTPAIRRWEHVLDRPAPCPTQVTGGLRRWVAAHKDDPTLMDPAWLARHAPHDDRHARPDDPERRRVVRRLLAADRGRMLLDPLFVRWCVEWDADRPIPATRLPDRSVLDYWKHRSRMAKFPSAAHLSPRFVEWMMGLEDRWVTDPLIWRGVPGNHRNLQLRALGNGVVPQQAATAINWCLNVRERLAR